MVRVGGVPHIRTPNGRLINAELSYKKKGRVRITKTPERLRQIQNRRFQRLNTRFTTLIGDVDHAHSSGKMTEAQKKAFMARISGTYQSMSKIIDHEASLPLYPKSHDYEQEASNRRHHMKNMRLGLWAREMKVSDKKRPMPKILGR